MDGPQIWDRVQRLAERAPTIADLRVHRLELVAAELCRRRAEPVPAELRDEELLAAATALAAPVALARARAAYGGPLVLMKGPEIALRYPEPALRPFCDLDLLADDAPAAHGALLQAGFAIAGRWADHVELHHLRPLCWPGLEIAVEVHSRVNVPAGLTAPDTRAIIHAAQPARFGGGEVLAPAPAAHALIAAAHSWAHAPLACIGQLADVALLAAEAEPGEIDALARHWGWTRMWHTTRAATEALFGAASPTVPMRLWGRHLFDARERTLFARHLEEATSPLWGLPPIRAPAGLARVTARRIRPSADETWRRKLRRVRRAAGNARLRHSEHDARLPAEDRRIGAPRDLQDAPAPERRSGS